MSEIMTVLGPVSADRLGVTLAHEHLVVSANREPELAVLLKLYDVDLAVAEVERFKAAGGSTIVELTNKGIGRDPAALRNISRASGVQIVMGCGWYREPHLEHDVYERSVGELAEDIVRDLTVGVDGTGIRAGIIGEIGSGQRVTDRRWISPAEERSFRSAARAHKRTGVTISTHAIMFHQSLLPPGLEQLDLLTEEDVDLGHVIVGHSDSTWNSDYHEALAARGAWVEFDLLHDTSTWQVERHLRIIQEFLARGYLHHLLISHDVCMRTHLTAYGGGGYAFILESFVPRMLDAGLSREQVDVILIDNPRRVLGGERPYRPAS